MPVFSAFNYSVPCCCRKRLGEVPSCQCLSRAILESSTFLFVCYFLWLLRLKRNLIRLQVGTATDILIWAQKNARKHSCLILFFFCLIYVCLVFTTLLSPLPCYNSYPGVTWQALYSLAHCSACLRSNREKLQFEDALEVSFPRVHLRRTIVHAAYTHTEYTRLPVVLAVTWYADYTISGFDLYPNDHTRHTVWYTTCRVYLHVISYRYHAIYSMITLNIAWYTENSKYDSEHMFLIHQCFIPGIFKSFSCHMRFLYLSLCGNQAK